MKNSGVLFSAAFFLVCAAVLSCPLPAFADDSGDEYCVPILRWNCWGCDMEVFTFDPDNLDASSTTYKDNKFRHYQAANWIMLKDGSPIPECRGASDKAHLFEETDDVTLSPSGVYERIGKFVVLKNGPTVKVRIITLKCYNDCSRAIFKFFYGDDADMYERLNWRETGRTFNMATHRRASICKTIFMGDIKWSFHLLGQNMGIANVKSIDIRNDLQNLWFSD